MINVEKGIENCGSEEIYNAITAMFCKDGHKRVKNLQNAVGENDFDVFSLETHSLKSVAATIGATELAVLAANANARCKKNDRKVIDEMGQEVISQYQSAIRELEK